MAENTENIFFVFLLLLFIFCTTAISDDAVIIHCVTYMLSLFFHKVILKYSVILSVLDPRKCECLKDYSLDFEHAYMTTYLAS